MATLLTDGITVGAAGSLGPPKANAAVLGEIWEFRPTPPPGEDGEEQKFISTYEPFTLPITAIPTLPNEIIISLTITKTSCIIEDPLPGAPTTKSKDAKLNIKASPYWAPGIFLEPLVLTTVGNATIPANISGYFTERNWYDREITVSYLNAVSKFTSDGFFYAPLANFPINLPFDLRKINIMLPSAVNVNTFYPLSLAAAEKTESEILQGYFNSIGQVISYKGTDIKKLRFLFEVEIISDKGIFKSKAFMIAQYNQNKANKRLKYLLTRRKPKAKLNIPEEE